MRNNALEEKTFEDKSGECGRCDTLSRDGRIGGRVFVPHDPALASRAFEHHSSRRSFSTPAFNFGTTKQKATAGCST
jgi:hypothetical protein